MKSVFMNILKCETTIKINIYNNNGQFLIKTVRDAVILAK